MLLCVFCFVFLLSFIYLFIFTVLRLYSPGWPQTQNNPLAWASQILEIQVWGAILGKAHSWTTNEMELNGKLLWFFCSEFSLDLNSVWQLTWHSKHMKTSIEKNDISVLPELSNVIHSIWLPPRHSCSGCGIVLWVFLSVTCPALGLSISSLPSIKFNCSHLWGIFFIYIPPN